MSSGSNLLKDLADNVSKNSLSLPPLACYTYLDTLEPWPLEEVDNYLLACLGTLLGSWRACFGCCTLPAYFAYTIESLLAGVCCFSELDEYTARFGVDLGHGLDLVPLFGYIALVDTNGIYLENPFDEAISEVK